MVEKVSTSPLNDILGQSEQDFGVRTEHILDAVGSLKLVESGKIMNVRVELSVPVRKNLAERAVEPDGPPVERLLVLVQGTGTDTLANPTGLLFSTEDDHALHELLAEIRESLKAPDLGHFCLTMDLLDVLFEVCASDLMTVLQRRRGLVEEHGFLGVLTDQFQLGLVLGEFRKGVLDFATRGFRSWCLRSVRHVVDVMTARGTVCGDTRQEVVGDEREFGGRQIFQLCSTCRRQCDDISGQGMGKSGR